MASCYAFEDAGKPEAAAKCAAHAMEKVGLAMDEFFSGIDPPLLSLLGRRPSATFDDAAEINVMNYLEAPRTELFAVLAIELPHLPRRVPLLRYLFRQPFGLCSPASIYTLHTLYNYQLQLVGYGCNYPVVARRQLVA